LNDNNSNAPRHLTNKMNTATSTTSTPLVSIVGIPFRGGQPKGGVDLAPAALRDAGLVRAIKEIGYAVKDLGDIDASNPAENDDGNGTITTEQMATNAKNSRWVGDVNLKAADLITNELKGSGKSDNFVLSIGGDHSIAIGTISGLLDTYASPKQNDEVDLCVIWVDAHADINTPSGSISGNIHGMPVAFLMREESLVDSWTIPGFEWTDPASATRNRRLNPRKLVYIGLRDVDEAEEEILRRFNIKSYRMPDVRAKGINKVMEEIVEYLNLGAGSTSKDRLHLSFDIDGLDPGACPATGTAVEDGLTVDEGRAICEACGKTGRLVSMDLVEVNPALSDEAGALQTVQAGLSLVQTALASRPQVLRRSLDA
jgi:arginase